MYSLSPMFMFFLLNALYLALGQDCSDYACPTYCENGYEPNTVWVDDSGCVVFCEDEPTDGDCQPGGSGCESSCKSSDDDDGVTSEELAGIVVGVWAATLLCVGVIYCLKVRFFTKSVSDDMKAPIVDMRETTTSARA